MTELSVVGRVLLGRDAAQAFWPDRVVWLDALLEGRALLRLRARTFRLATLFLPRAMQDDIAIIYAFCRIADDLADESSDDTVAARELERLEQELLGRAAPRPVVSAFRTIARRQGIALTHAVDLLNGVRSDLGVVRIADESALKRYGFAVASTVGLMMNRVLGVRDPGGDAFAIDLGLAMQLTNIVRDVREDASMGRVYLPATLLARHDITAEQLLDGTVDRIRLKAACHELLAMADGCYRNAASGIGCIPLRARFGIAIALRAYAAIGWRIRRLDHDPFAGRVVVPGIEKAWWVLSALLRTAIDALPWRQHQQLTDVHAGVRLPDR